LHQELLSGVRQTAAFVANKKARSNQQQKLPFAGLRKHKQLRSNCRELGMGGFKAIGLKRYLPACIEFTFNGMPLSTNTAAVVRASLAGQPTFPDAFFRFRGVLFNRPCGRWAIKYSVFGVSVYYADKIIPTSFLHFGHIGYT